ncbi:MAG: metal ABC transporter substrate-binding protein, partial [Clostridia bacterium]|nr:metal ABC transporter substrate-binding protein [Clostridia bacterium]
HDHEHEHEDEDEEEHDHNHEEGAFDEHIWTSPENAIKMVNALEEAMEKVDNENSNKYKENADKYIAQIKDVDSKIQNIVDNKVRDRLIFADKMPMQYFIDYYNLKVSAAFDGCSTEVDPSAKTIAYLQNMVKEEKIPVVLYIELNPGTVAKTIANETGAEAMQIQTLHNVSLDDFNNGETWVSLMTRNIEVLKKALQ